MGQKGKFVSQRSGYSNFWHDIWYSFKNYHSVYFQNILIRDFLLFLILYGFSAVKLYNEPVKKVNSMIYHSDFFANNYYLRGKSLNISGYFDNVLRPVRGAYLTQFHILKHFNYIIILCNGYIWPKRSKFKFLKTERRLFLFYSLVISLDRFISNI